METVTLPRTGDRPVRFTGEEVATATSRQSNGPCQSRWYELALYRTDSGRYVLAIGYRSQWEGELPEDRVYVEDSAAAVAAQLQGAIPELPLLAFPPGAQYEEKRAYVAERLRRCYDAAVGELLQHVEAEDV